MTLNGLKGVKYAYGAVPYIHCIPLVTSVVNKKKSSPVLYEWQKMSLMPTTNKRIKHSFPYINVCQAGVR